jgi:MscS family membrane protein
MKEFFQHPLYGDYGQDTVAELCWCLGIMFVGIVFRKLLTKAIVHLLFRFLKKHAGKKVGYEKLFLLLKKPMGYLILLIAIYLGFDRLSFPNEWHLASEEKFGIKMIISRGFTGLFAAAVTFAMLRMVDYFGLVLKHRAKVSDEKADDQLVPFFKECMKVLIIVLSVFVILGSVFHINVASLIAGLGIGGLAVALAAKESIENLLGSFTIFLDKPFLVSDNVRVAGIEGTIESIGFRSTRIRTVENTLVTLPNKKMVDAELDNLSQRSQRRVKFTINLVYSSTPAQLKSITQGILALLAREPIILQTDQQVRLHEFGSNSINLLVLYYLESADYDTHLRILEEINYGVMEIVQSNGTDFSSQSATGFIHPEKPHS